MKITPEMFGLTKEEIAKFEKQDERLAVAKAKWDGYDKEATEIQCQYIAEKMRLASIEAYLRACIELAGDDDGLFDWYIAGLETIEGIRISR